MRTIYDYKDIRRLDQSLISNELCSGIIIAATSSLTTALRTRYPDYTVIGIHDLIDEMIPEWDESTKDLKNYISLRNSMDSYIAEQDNAGPLFISLQRNAADIWNAILLLIEADVYPHDIPDDLSAPIKHFKSIWKQLEIENSALMNLRAQFSFRLSDKDNVITGLESSIKRAYGDDITISLSETCLFFLGFYFITPIQARMIDVLEAAGLKTAYLNCRDNDYPYVGEIWEKTFSKEYSAGVSQDIQPNMKFNNCFGDMLNGRKPEIDAEIVSFDSDLAFARMMKAPLESDSPIFTPDPKECEKILKEFYPESFDRKHLLAFPVGQYIYHLHMMWNSMHDRLEMSYDHVFKCFASGWLEEDGINGRDYLYTLSKIKLFFKDCTTFEEWRERIDKFKEAKECISVFEVEDGPNKRWHELLGNPFRQLSVYNASGETLSSIEKLLLKLMDDAEYLFSVSGKVQIGDHFKKIREIIESHLDSDDILEDEIQIAKELVRSLDIAGTYEQDCPVSAIKDAVVLLIGGHFDEVDTLDQETSSVGARILPLSQVESNVLNDGCKDIYLVLADEFTLPGVPRTLPWPLSNALLDSLQIEDREDTKRYVDCMRSVIDNRPLSYRYLFYSFLSNVNETTKPKIHISWLRDQGAKTVSASPYVLMMWEKKTKGLKDPVSSIDFETDSDRIVIKDAGLSIQCTIKTAPEDVQMDHALCRYRYLYSYLVNYLPEYSSDFHYSFLLSNLIKAFCNESKKSKREVSKELFELFPFFRNVELRQASDYAGSTVKTDRSLIYDEAEYPDTRLDIHFLNARTLALRAYDGDALDDDELNSRCTYCPYSNICIFKNETEETFDE